MQLSRPIGRGVEGSRPQRRPRPPRPRWALPWEAQLQSTSETWMIMMIGMCRKAKESTVISTSSSWTSKHTVEQLRKGKWNWMFCHNVHIQKKTWKTSSKIWSSLFMFFGHCGGTSYNPLEFVEAAAWLKTVKRLGNSARILFCFFRPQSLGSEVKSVPNRRKMVRIEGKLKATCDTQKGTRQDHDGTPIRNVKNLKQAEGRNRLNLMNLMRFEISTPRLRCHKLFHPQKCHLWGETHSEGKAMNASMIQQAQTTSSNFHKPSSYDQLFHVVSVSFSNFSPVHSFHLAWRKGIANRANASQRDLEVPRRLGLRICKNFRASNFLWIHRGQVSRDNWVCQYEKSIPSFGCKNDSAKIPNMATLFLWPLIHPHFEEAAGRPPSYEPIFNH